MTYDELLDKWLRKLGRPCTAGEIVHDLRQLERPVRCKDCKFFSMTTLGMPFGACWHRADEINGLSGEDNGYTVCHRVDSPDFFCAWGERREDG